MLVLSRNVNDQIVFPSLGITVEVLNVKGRQVSVGVDAPADVRILRGELMTQPTKPHNRSPVDEAKQRDHKLRNRINDATMRIQLASKLFADGETELATTTLNEGLSALCSIDQLASKKSSDADSGSAKRSHATREARKKPTSNVAKSTNKDTASGGPRIRVLVVDDDNNERVLMASYLRRCGFEVDEAKI
ncbi:MAG: carbon storage regulator [Planctomycetota bacterium]